MSLPWKLDNPYYHIIQVQTGLARTGRLLAVDHEDVKPDILILILIQIVSPISKSEFTNFI